MCEVLDIDSQMLVFIYLVTTEAYPDDAATSEGPIPTDEGAEGLSKTFQSALG